MSLNDKISYVDKFHVKVGTKNANAVLLVKYIKEFQKELKEEWRLKARRMEIMSGEVAIYELECLLEEKLGKELCVKQESGVE